MTSLELANASLIEALASKLQAQGAYVAQVRLVDAAQATVDAFHHYTCPLPDPGSNGGVALQGGYEPTTAWLQANGYPDAEMDQWDLRVAHVWDVAPPAPVVLEISQHTGDDWTVPVPTPFNWTLVAPQ